MAAMPSWVASTRSKAVGVPPRWTCPRMVTLVSIPVRCSISAAMYWLIPPSRGRPLLIPVVLGELHIQDGPALVQYAADGV